MLSKILIYTGVGLMLFAGGLSLVRKNITPKTAIRTLSTSQKASANPVPKSININDMTNQLDSVTEQYPNLDIGVAVTDLKTKQSYLYGDKAAYYGASTTKILVATMYLHEVETGKRKITDRVDGVSSASVIKAMIEQSDNDAWMSLRKKLGNANTDVYARSIGLSSFTSKDNLINISDMSLLLQKLYDGELINEEHTNMVLGHMKKSIRNYIAPALGSEYTVYHKAGWLDDRLMDTAFIEHNNHKYVLVIFSKTFNDNYDFNEGSDVFGAITKVVDAEISN